MHFWEGLEPSELLEVISFIVGFLGIDEMCIKKLGKQLLGISKTDVHSMLPLLLKILPIISLYKLQVLLKNRNRFG